MRMDPSQSMDGSPQSSGSGSVRLMPQIGPNHQVSMPPLKMSARIAEQEYANRDHKYAWGLAVPIMYIARPESSHLPHQLRGPLEKNSISSIDSPSASKMLALQSNGQQTVSRTSLPASHISCVAPSNEVSVKSEHIPSFSPSGATNASDIKSDGVPALREEDTNGGTDQSEAKASTSGVQGNNSKKRKRRRSCWINFKRKSSKKTKIEKAKKDKRWSGMIHPDLKEEAARRNSLITIPGSPHDVWTETEISGFILALYFFGKDFNVIERFLESKKMKDIIHYYYGKFYGQPAFCRWAGSKSNRSRKCVHGSRLLSGWRQDEFLKRLQPHIPETHKSAVAEVVKAYNDRQLTVEEFVTELKATVGLETLVQCVGIGVSKLDLTAIHTDSGTKGSQPPCSNAPELPSGKACSSLSKEATLGYLTGNFRISKTRAQDLFWEAVWPRLLARGWSSQQSDLQQLPGCKSPIVFLMPNVKLIEKGSSVKGVHYYDSVSEILKLVSDEPGLLDEPHGVVTKAVLEAREEEDEDQVCLNEVLLSPTDVPSGKVYASLSKESVLEFLNGNMRMSKTRAQDLFWEAVWPRLLARGWSSQKPKLLGGPGSRSSSVFLPPSVKKFEKGVFTKGIHYYDSVSEMLKLVYDNPILLDPPGVNAVNSIEMPKDEEDEDEEEEQEEVCSTDGEEESDNEGGHNGCGGFTGGEVGTSQTQKMGDRMQLTRNKDSCSSTEKASEKREEERDCKNLGDIGEIATGYTTIGETQERAAELPRSSSSHRRRVEEGAKSANVEKIAKRDNGLREKDSLRVQLAHQEAPKPHPHIFMESDKQEDYSPSCRESPVRGEQNSGSRFHNGRLNKDDKEIEHSISVFRRKGVSSGNGEARKKVPEDWKNRSFSCTAQAACSSVVEKRIPVALAGEEPLAKNCVPSTLVGGGASVQRREGSDWDKNSLSHRNGAAATELSEGCFINQGTHKGIADVRNNNCANHYTSGGLACLSLHKTDTGEKYSANDVFHAGHAVGSGAVMPAIANTEVQILEHNNFSSIHCVDCHNESVSSEADGKNLLSSIVLHSTVPAMTANEQVTQMEAEEKEGPKLPKLSHMLCNFPCPWSNKLSSQNVKCMPEHEVGDQLQALESNICETATADVCKPQSRKRPAEAEANQCTTLGAWLGDWSHLVVKKKRGICLDVSSDSLDQSTYMISNRSGDVFDVNNNAARVYSYFNEGIQLVPNKVIWKLDWSLTNRGSFPFPLPISQRTVLNRGLQLLRFKDAFVSSDMKRLLEQQSHEEHAESASCTVTTSSCKLVSEKTRCSDLQEEASAVSSCSSLSFEKFPQRLTMTLGPSSQNSLHAAVLVIDTDSRTSLKRDWSTTSNREVSCPRTSHNLVTKFSLLLSGLKRARKQLESRKIVNIEAPSTESLTVQREPCTSHTTLAYPTTSFQDRKEIAEGIEKVPADVADVKPIASDQKRLFPNISTSGDRSRTSKLRSHLVYASGRKHRGKSCSLPAARDTSPEHFCSFDSKLKTPVDVYTPITLHRECIDGVVNSPRSAFLSRQNPVEIQQERDKGVSEFVGILNECFPKRLKTKGKRSARVRSRLYSLKPKSVGDDMEDIEEVLETQCSSQAPWHLSNSLPSGEKVPRSLKLRQRRSSLPCKGSCVPSASGLQAPGLKTDLFTKGQAGNRWIGQSSVTEEEGTVPLKWPAHDIRFSLRRTLSEDSLRTERHNGRKVATRWRVFSVC